MKTPFKQILLYYWNAKTKYSLHSPYLYAFYERVLKDTRPNQQTVMIEQVRAELLSDTRSIRFVEMGAGSQTVSGDFRMVREIARSSLSGQWQCQILYNLLAMHRPNNVLEIGTSLGISGAYLAVGLSSAKVWTLEGNPESVRLARGVMDKLAISNISVVEGNFDDTLGPILTTMGTVDFAFIDGNHRKEATIAYFNSVLEHCNSGSIIVVDDIYWSSEMNDAWQTIIAHPAVAFSIDLFRMGIIYLDNTLMPRQHFQLIDYRYKPWAIGVFG